MKALEGGKIAVALRLAAANHIVGLLDSSKNPSPKYAEGMPEW